MMLKYLIENSDLKAILRFGPQNFFKAVDLFKTIEVVNQVRKNSKDQAFWAQVCEGSHSHLKKAGGLIHLISPPLKKEPAQFTLNATHGDAILRWFFYQIFHSENWMIDFRRENWSLDSEGVLRWAPQPLYFKPSEGFQQGIRNLYLGFYKDQPQVFHSGLEALGVLPAHDIFREHFGQGDQSAVEFHLKHLESTFAQVFAECAKKGAHVHPEFAAFGVMLLGLYETFEGHAFQLNVRAAFGSVG